MAQALLEAPKVLLQRMVELRCSVPYSMEGLLRREIAAAQAELMDVAHGSLVTLLWRMPEEAGAAFVQHLNDIGQGRIGWREP
ncbi:hypothetical protein D3C71_1644640 [compost metagenome]